MKIDVEYIANRINQLSESQYNELVREFIRSSFEADEVRITNGPYDGGRDLEYRNGDVWSKQAVQITVQKTAIEAKISSDCNKVLTKSDGDSLYFFCSVKISNQKRRKLVREMRNTYSIRLELIDANWFADSFNDFPHLQDQLHKIEGVLRIAKKPTLDHKLRTAVNALSIGKKSAEVKKRLIEGLIVTQLYAEGALEKEKLITSVLTAFHMSIPESYIAARVDYVHSKKKIEIIANGQYSLCDSTKVYLERMIANAQHEEEEFGMQLHELLNTYSLAGEFDHIYKLVQDVFQSYFKVGVRELSTQDDTTKAGFSALTMKIGASLNLVTSFDESKVSEIVKQILKLCAENTYLMKIGLSSMYVHMLNSEDYEEYNARVPFLQILDAQILVRLLCNLSDGDSRTEDYMISGVALYYESIQSLQREVKLGTFRDYVSEASSLLYNAIRIASLISEDKIIAMGSTSNPFIWFYLSRKTKSRFKSLKEFISKGILGGIGISPELSREVILRRLERIFGNLDIVVYSPASEIPAYVKLRRAYIDSGFVQKKSSRAINTDVKCCASLVLNGSEDFDSDEHIQRHFITYDHSIFELSKIMSKKGGFYDLNVAHPSKIAAMLALSEFKVDPELIQHSLLSYVENQMNDENQESFMDILTRFFNMADLSKIEVAQRLVDLEEDLANDKPSESRSNIAKEAVTLVLSRILDLYHSQGGEAYSRIQSIFMNPDNTEDLIRLIKKGTETLAATGIQSLGKEYIDEFESLS